MHTIKLLSACVFAAFSTLTQAAPFEAYERVFKSNKVEKVLEEIEDKYGLRGATIVDDTGNYSIQIKVFPNFDPASGYANEIKVNTTYDPVTFKVNSVTSEAPLSVVISNNFSPTPIHFYEISLQSKLVKAAVKTLEEQGVTNISRISEFNPDGVGSPGQLVISFTGISARIFVDFKQSKKGCWEVASATISYQ